MLPEASVRSVTSEIGVRYSSRIGPVTSAGVPNTGVDQPGDEYEFPGVVITDAVDELGICGQKLDAKQG